MKVELSLERAEELLRAAVAERGANYVYVNPKWENPEDRGACNYLHGDEPGCIIGHVLIAAGVDRSALRQNEGSSVAKVAQILTNADRSTRRLLDRVQCSQDTGATWGDALRCGGVELG